MPTPNKPLSKWGYYHLLRRNYKNLNEILHIEHFAQYLGSCYYTYQSRIVYFFIVVKKYIYIKCAILTIFNCTVQ